MEEIRQGIEWIVNTGYIIQGIGVPLAILWAESVMGYQMYSDHQEDKRYRKETDRLKSLIDSEENKNGRT